jgi:hypothetical protein
MTDEISVHCSTYLRVFRVLDQVCCAHLLAASSDSTIYGAIDSLRSIGASQDHVTVAEGISVALQRLIGAVRTNDECEQAIARRDLDTLRTAWLRLSILENLH